MEPSSFAEANTVLSKPDDMTADECEALSVLRAVTADRHPIVISCWRPTVDELEEIKRTGRVWLIVYGVTMPPVILCGMKPFEAAKPTEGEPKGQS